MALFQFTTKSGKHGALFSIKESARAHRYITWMNPAETALCLVVVGAVFTVLLACLYGHWQAVAPVLGQMPLKGILALGCAVGVFFAVCLYPHTYNHVCHDHYLKIHRSIVLNQPYQSIDADEMESIILKKISEGGETFVVAKVRFKPLRPKFLGRRWNARFGISDPKAVGQLTAWANDRGIAIVEDNSTLVS